MKTKKKFMNFFVLPQYDVSLQLNKLSNRKWKKNLINLNSEKEKEISKFLWWLNWMKLNESREKIDRANSTNNWHM